MKKGKKELEEKYLAKYFRISKDDGDIKEESNSITNQRKIVDCYIKNHKELSKYPIREFIEM